LGYAAKDGIPRQRRTLMKIIHAMACLAWAGVALSSAAAADAYVITMQSPQDYASCSADWEYEENPGVVCDYYTPYIQNIRLLSTHCSQGGCSGDSYTINTDTLYSYGRKTVTQVSGCALYAGNYIYIYGLGSCDC
jgi:hypothetical protein